jgi:hypothetical protein
MISKRLLVVVSKSGHVVEMPETTPLLVINKPHLTISVYESMLRMDVKDSVKNDIEEALENTPVLKQTIGSILGIFAPLHVRLSDIDSVNVDKEGKVKIKLPRHRDLVLPLGPTDGKKLTDKLNELIPVEKQKELERIMKRNRLRRIESAERERQREEMTTPPAGMQFPTVEPPGVLDEEKTAAEDEER